MRSSRWETHNWAGNQRCVPVRTERPETTDAVAEVVTRAATEGLRVKVMGAGHSFTAAATTDGVLVDLCGLCAVHSFDSETGTVLVDAGIRLADLNRALEERGRALPNLGDIDRQTLAGATQTGTHGTGPSFGNLSTGIVGLELVTGTGRTLWCDSLVNADVWRAARVGLGALGIVTRIELATEPSFRLRSREAPEDVEHVLTDWDEFVTSADHAEFFWLPGSNRCLVKRNDRTDAPSTRWRNRRTRFEKLAFENAAFGMAMRTARRFPGSRDRIATVVGRSARPVERIDSSHRVFATPRLVRFMEMEYAIPIDAVPDAFRRVQRLVDSLPDRPSFPVEVRTSAADDIPLSTAHGRATGWIAVHRYRGLPYDEYFRAVERIMDDYGGRPHWGKYHYQSAETLSDRYPEWDRFAALRRRLDPEGIFRNAYLDRVLDDLVVE